MSDAAQGTWSNDGAANAVRGEIAEELRFHIEESRAELVGAGWEPEAARVEAVRRFGDVDAVAAACFRERHWDRIMLQRINTGLIALLIVVLAVQLIRGDARASSQRQSLDAMQATLVDLSGQNARLLDELARAAAPRLVEPGEELPPARMPDGTAPESALETAFAEVVANRPGSPGRLCAFGDDAVPYCVALLKGEHRIAGLTQGQTQFMGANLLGLTGSSQAVDPLLAALEDPFFNVRRCAALALGKLGDRRAMEPLEKLAASDPYVYRDKGQSLALVRIDAEKALGMLRATDD